MPHSIAAFKQGALVSHSNKVAYIDASNVLFEWDAGSSHADNLTVSPDGTKILAVHHANKSVVVFNEKLEEIKKFDFPKRPISLAFAPNGHVLVADKFGDVYELDLEGSVVNDKGEFNLSPVLGHVSMLLKVLATEKHIITADRDEHIKVSRLPQPFVIEGFCFGHRQYVSDLCVVENSLISGGGDPFLVKWDLTNFTETARLDLSETFDCTEFNILRIKRLDSKHVLLILQEAPVILKIEVEGMTIVEQYGLPEQPTDLSVGDKVWVATKDSVLITDLSSTEAFPHGFGDSEVRVLMQHEMRKRAEH